MGAAASTTGVDAERYKSQNAKELDKLGGT
jgi:hypothetical protein